MTQHLRIWAKDFVGHNARITHIADDGTETDISGVFNGIDISIRPGELVTAHMEINLDALLLEADILAELASLQNVSPE